MAKIGVGSSPRSVLGQWEIDGQRELMAPETKGFNENNGFGENQRFSENQVFVKKQDFSEKKGFAKNQCFETQGFDQSQNFSKKRGFTEPQVFAKNQFFPENRGFYEHTVFYENKRFSKSLIELGATGDGKDVKCKAGRKSRGVSREKCVKEEKPRVSRVFSPNSAEHGGAFRGKRRKKKENQVEEDENSNDPLVVLGSDIMAIILYRLDARSLAQSILVSQGWQASAANDSLWAKKCEELWFGKAHLPRAAMQRGLSKLAAYSISVLDAKRTRIMKEDLCSHVWEFRFKTPAPLYWLNLDPSWRGTGPPMRRYFHPDGSQTADPTDRVWGGHECTYSIVTFTDQGKIREHYVRINRWPRMSVSRKHDWGWELDNHVYCYSSIPDADKEGGTGPLYPIC